MSLRPPTSTATAQCSDTLAVCVVTRATDGWVLFADTDGDGSLAGERPVHDYLRRREVRLGRCGADPRMTWQPILGERRRPPARSRFDSYTHGTTWRASPPGTISTASPARRVAPGAELLGLKIANSAQGSITTSGSLVRAVEYAIRFAETRRLPLVLNLSFGVGNEVEGRPGSTG